MKKNLLILSASLLLALSGCAPETQGNSSIIPPKTSSPTVVGTSSEPKAKYTVTFNSDGGSPVDAQVVEEGEKATKPSDPTKAETEKEIYSFEGWYVGETLYDFTKPVTGNLTLVAHWKIIHKFAVTFDSAGGSEVAPQVVKEGEKATKPSDPTKAETDDAAYAFAGWYLGETEYDFNSAVTQDLTLIAHWTTLTKYVVTFNSDGGSEVASQRIVSGQKASKPENPTKEETDEAVYAFAGWYLGDSKYDFSSAVTANITLTAHWNITAKYVVTFDSNGGSEVASQRIVSGQKASKPADPTKAETDEAVYAFDGWYAGEAAYDFDQPVTSNLTLVAHWRITHKFTVTFDSVGGSEVAPQVVKEEGQATKPSDPTKAETEKEIYSFEGWYVGDALYDFTKPVTGNLTLVAHWKITHKFTVTFDTNGGSKVDSKVVKEGEKVAKPSDPTKAETDQQVYVFAGWYLGDNVYDFSSAVTADITLTARWDSNAKYEHILSVAPTDTRPGVKESYVNLLTNEIVFTAPVGNKIIDKNLTDSELAALPSTNLNYIAPGDFDSWLYQSDNFAKNLIAGKVSALTANASEKAMHFHCGEANDNSTFQLTNRLLKTANDLGYKYLNFTVKATHVDPTKVTNRYAIISQGNSVVENFWKTNYSEYQVPLNKGVTFTLPLAPYNGFKGDDANDFAQFNLRTMDEPAVNKAESDVILSDIRFLKEDYSSFVHTQTNLSSALYHIEEDGTVHNATFYYNETTAGGYSDKTGFTPAYTQFLINKGFKDASATISCTLDADQGDSTRFYSTKAGGVKYDIPTGAQSYSLEPDNYLYCGIPHDGAKGQQGGTIQISLTLRDYLLGSLKERLYHNDTANSPYGIDAVETATATGGSFVPEGAGPESGGVGDTKMSEGAGIIVITDGKASSHGAKFFAYHLNVANYVTPKDGDFVIFKKGVYEDPTNQWNVARKLTLGADLYYKYSATHGAFLVATLAEAQAAGYVA